jgi:signal transduction histidine kinase
MITLLDEAAQGKPIESIQCQRVAKDGRIHDMWLTITPLRLNSDLPVAVMTTETEHADADHASSARGQLVDRLLKAHEEERRLLAHELHDETGQLVTALLQRLQKIEEAETLDAVRSEIPAIRELTEEVLREVKRIARGLRPGELDVLGLRQALQAYIEEYRRTYPVTVDAHLQELDGGRLPSEIEVCLFRIVQEALTNAAKYAEATNISVILTQADGKVSLIIEDDGCGFDVDRTMRGAEQSQGLGLLGIRERARAAGGEATVESSPGYGTSVYVKIPIQQ